ncbi:MAG: glycerophosphodiester phosphodiesterase family protein [Candidatus Bathyarchaeota archaeon]|nr:glycerophosphodiester phosphodiesterase family protein [Candidatus Bathyarchaeota archaeon]
MVQSIGHRGAAGYEPENTLRSFMKAVELGVDMVELDIHVCASGELVVIHDETVDRTTDGTGAVAEMTLEALQGLDAGKGEKIPQLREVFEALVGKAEVNVELKGRGCAEPLHNLVMEFMDAEKLTYEDFMATSFRWEMLEALRSLNEPIRLGPIVHSEPDVALGFADRLKAYSVNPYHEYINSSYVEEAHLMGIKVYPWTVNEHAEIERMKEIGVDGIISDYPDRV